MDGRLWSASCWAGRTPISDGHGVQQETYIPDEVLDEIEVARIDQEFRVEAIRALLEAGASLEHGDADPTSALTLARAIGDDRLDALIDR